MVADRPSAVLFCCDYNAVRSPMAEAILKSLHGRDIYVQSAGVRRELEIDGFSIAVCQEIGIELSRHQARSIAEMRDWGDDLSSFDLIVALSPAAQRAALELTRDHAVDVEYWPTLDPTGLGESRDEKLELYRQVRDQIRAKIKERFD